MVNGPVQGATLDPWPLAGCGQPFYFICFFFPPTLSENVFAARGHGTPRAPPPGKAAGRSLITIISLPSASDDNNELFTKH